MRSVCLIVAALMLVQTSAPPSRVRVLAESIPGAVAPEFASDLLMRVADSTPASREPSEWRGDLYEHAFELARSAREPLPRYFRRDARARMRVNPIGQDMRLDTLSLQVRAFNALLPLRRERALELAATIAVAVPTLTCADWMVPNPAGTFDIARHAHHLLERQLLSLHSSTQLAPAFEAIVADDVSTSESRALLTGLATTMRSLDDDDVSFTDTLGPTWAAVKRAIDSAGDASLSNLILDAFRTYLVRHLSGPRCGSGLSTPTRPSAENDILAEIDETLVDRDRPPLTRRERTAARTIESGKRGTAPAGLVFGDAGLWRSNASKKLMTQVTALRDHVQAGRPVDDRRSAEWYERLSQVYAAMSTWSRSDEPTADDYLRERGILLQTLVDLIPSGVDRIRALGDLLAFLKSDGRELFDDNVWISRLRALMDACRNSPLEWSWMLQALIDSGDPVMRLYAQIEQLQSEP